MANYDYGGGCPCGLYRECPPNCSNYTPDKDADIEYLTVGKKMKLNEEDDFGFTFTDSQEIQTKVSASEDKLAGLRKLIMPLLKNLMKNPEKDTIVWPNRKQKIEEFIKKMDDYIKS